MAKKSKNAIERFILATKGPHTPETIINCLNISNINASEGMIFPNIGIKIILSDGDNNQAKIADFSKVRCLESIKYTDNLQLETFVMPENDKKEHPVHVDLRGCAYLENVVIHHEWQINNIVMIDQNANNVNHGKEPRIHTISKETAERIKNMALMNLRIKNVTNPEQKQELELMLKQYKRYSQVSEDCKINANNIMKTLKDVVLSDKSK